MNVAILGAGISGLAAAYRLHQLMPAATIRVFDRRNRTGGVLETISKGILSNQGTEKEIYQIEQSADNFITTVPWGMNLCRELGLGDEIIQTNPNTRRTYVVRKGKLYLLPDGFLMMAPTKLFPMATTPLLSPLGKLRAGLEMFIPSRKDYVDESMASFVRRRLGREVFERLVEPLVSGVYAADMEKLSVLATLPRFRDMERQYGSLIWAMQRQLRANRASHQAEQSGARDSMFVTLKKGLSVIGETIVQKLPPETMQLGKDVAYIEQSTENKTQNNQKAKGQWKLILQKPCTLSSPLSGGLLSGNETFGEADRKDNCVYSAGCGTDNPVQPSGNPHLLNFDAVIVATSTTDAAKILRNSRPELAEKLGAIEHEGTAVATFAFDSTQIKRSFSGMGFVVPKIENNPILAGSFSSIKYEHRAPQGKFLIRVFAGGARRPELAEMSSEQLAPLLFTELRKIISIDGEPLFASVAHWPRTMPQYNVGHRERIADIESMAASDPSLALAGNAFSGVGIPSCIQTGFDAAEKIHAFSCS